MITYLIITVSIIYCLLDNINLNNEINTRLSCYEFNSKKVKGKPLCSKRKMVCLFLLAAALMLILVLISQTLTILIWSFALVINHFIVRRKIKNIRQLDFENFSYWEV